MPQPIKDRACGRLIVSNVSWFLTLCTVYVCPIAQESSVRWQKLCQHSCLIFTVFIISRYWYILLKPCVYMKKITYVGRDCTFENCRIPTDHILFKYFRCIVLIYDCKTITLLDSGNFEKAINIYFPSDSFRSKASLSYGQSDHFIGFELSPLETSL